MTYTARREFLLEKAMCLAEKISILGLTYSSLARYSRVTPQLIQYYFSSNQILRREALKYALAKKNMSVIIQGFVLKPPLLPNKELGKFKANLITYLTKNL